MKLNADKPPFEMRRSWMGFENNMPYLTHHVIEIILHRPDSAVVLVQLAGTCIRI